MWVPTSVTDRVEAGRVEAGRVEAVAGHAHVPATRYVIGVCEGGLKSAVAATRLDHIMIGFSSTHPCDACICSLPQFQLD